jgi:hypothetical protein
MKRFITISWLMVLSGAVVNSSAIEVCSSDILRSGSSFVAPNLRVAQTPARISFLGQPMRPMGEVNRHAITARARGTEGRAATRINIPSWANSATATRSAARPLLRPAAQNQHPLQIKPAPATLPIPIPMPAMNSSLRLRTRPAERITGLRKIQEPRVPSRGAAQKSGTAWTRKAAATKVSRLPPANPPAVVAKVSPSNRLVPMRNLPPQELVLNRGSSDPGPSNDWTNPGVDQQPESKNPMEVPENKPDDSGHGIEDFRGGDGPSGTPDRGSTNGGLDPDGKPFDPSAGNPDLSQQLNGPDAASGVSELNSFGNEGADDSFFGVRRRAGNAPLFNPNRTGSTVAEGDPAGSLNEVASESMQFRVTNDGKVYVQIFSRDASGNTIGFTEYLDDGYRAESVLLTYDKGFSTIRTDPNTNSVLIKVDSDYHVPHASDLGLTSFKGPGGRNDGIEGEGVTNPDEIRNSLIRDLGNPGGTNTSDPRIGLIGNPVKNAAGDTTGPADEPALTGGRANAMMTKTVNSQKQGQSGGKRPIDPSPDAPTGKAVGTPTISGKIIASRQVIDPIDLGSTAIDLGSTATKASNTKSPGP